ncbi:MAG: hypothetical protein ACOCQW_04405 [Halanaerobiaceae bacterium]
MIFYEKKENWIDYNAGSLLAGKEMDKLTEELFEYIIDLASKNILSRNEENDYREIAIFKIGVTL